MRWSSPIVLTVPLLVAFFACPLQLNASQQQPTSSTDAAPNDPVSFEQMRPLLKTYCFECHNTTKQKAGLNL
jgi:hypothetical protein